MGGEFGLGLIYFLYVVVGAPVLFVVLSYRARKSQNRPQARWGLFSGIASAIGLSIIGASWWYLNFPQDLSFENVVFFCIGPGFVIGAALYGIFVKTVRLFNDGGYS